MRVLSLLVLTVAAVLPLIGTASFANRAGADACAARLSPEAKLIYAAVIESAASTNDLRELVRTKARSLVMSGHISRGQARGAAEAAGVCLKRAR